MRLLQNKFLPVLIPKNPKAAAGGFGNIIYFQNDTPAEAGWHFLC
jgi:hypothetical protein